MSGSLWFKDSNSTPITIRGQFTRSLYEAHFTRFAASISIPIVVLEQSTLSPSRAPPDLPDLNRPQYVHQAMQHETSIRLVKVLHPYKDGTPRCKVEEHDMMTDSQAVLYRYSCLSYIWGPPEHSRWIILNDQPFHVRQNLWNFLFVISQFKVRSAERDITKLYPNTRQPHSNLQSTSVEFQNSSRRNVFEFLWIDALCIDQASTVEKNHQVQRMGHIYSRAEQVIAWLGDEPATAELFLHFLNYGASVVKNVDINKLVKWQLTLEQEGFLKAFGEAQYWKRAWITQEILLGDTVFLMAQGIVIHLSHLRKFVIHIGNRGFEPEVALNSYWDGPTDRYKPLRALVEDMTGEERLFSVLENMELYSHKLCAEPRHLAYSLVSVSNNGEKLEVDYECSVSKLAKNILSMSEGSTCIKRAAMVIRALKVDQAETGADADVSMVESCASSMLRHISPCEQCGEKCNTKALQLHPAQLARMKCICLHCYHFMPKEKIGIHQRAHLGHLILLPISKDVKQSSNWHLFWTPMGGGSWRKLEGHYEVVLNDKGAVRKLLLSAVILMELTDAAMDEESQRPSNVHEQTHESSWTTKWTVAE